MYRVRLHGRGGQGIKTASRVLGTAFFLDEFEVQDAPRYGAERRGAPIFAYVRASRTAINERGIIRSPGLVVIVDESLVPVPAAGIMAGAHEHTILLINTKEKAGVWIDRTKFPGQMLTYSASGEGKGSIDPQLASMACTGAAARLVGVISRASLEKAVSDELGPLGKAVAERSLAVTLDAYDAMAGHAGCVRESKPVPADEYHAPEWIDVPFEDARVSAPAIHGAATSVEVRTGLWRTMRPVIDYERCRKCWWLCSTFCPDSVISVNEEGYPEIDYDHCKGCMVCVARCLRHAIEPISESAARAEEKSGSP